MSSRFTSLETAVFDALAWELRDAAPDLAGQFAESLPGQRRNTGSGLSTELIVDRTRPPPLIMPSGRFGTVHAMVGDLPDPVAFQVELRAGQLLYLFGDAYGQDTRDIDFAAVPFDRVFTIDAAGESVAFDPVALMPLSPPLDLQVNTDHALSEPIDPPLTNTGALQRVQEATLPDSLEGAIPDLKEGRTSLLIGTWTVIAVFALVVTLIFRLPWIFGLFVAIGLGRMVQKPAVFSQIQRQVEARGNRKPGSPGV